jgi:mono/diheme cytochrome c family protein
MKFARKSEVRMTNSETNPNHEVRNVFLGFRFSDFIRHFQLLALCAASVAISGCRRDMFNQPSGKPLEPSEFFQDNHMASRPLVPNTVARGHLNEDEIFFTGKRGTNLVTGLPVPLSRELLDRGRERFDIYCAVCHGRTGEGNGMIVQRGFPTPPSFHIDRLRQAPIGHFFDVITQGYGIMYSYAERVDPADRWAISAYIRALQVSRNATLADLTPAERSRLEEAK